MDAKKLKKIQNQRKSERGFSLVELIIVILVIGVSIVPLTTLIRTNQRGIGDFTLAIQAEYFTQSVMEELIADYTALSRGYDYVINNWTGVSRSHPRMDMTAGVGIVEDTDAYTGIQYADVVVSVNMNNGFTTSLTCRIVDN